MPRGKRGSGPIRAKVTVSAATKPLLDAITSLREEIDSKNTEIKDVRDANRKLVALNKELEAKVPTYDYQKWWADSKDNQRQQELLLREKDQKIQNLMNQLLAERSAREEERKDATYAMGYFTRVLQERFPEPPMMPRRPQEQHWSRNEEARHP
jgi:hypothetical protein